jgi:glycosyltransferase involved in cell wall biosynthesis
MRVANIIEEGKVGGPQIRMVRVAKQLPAYMHTHIIMPRDNSEVFREICEEAGIRYSALVLSCITKRWSVALRYVFNFPIEVFRLRRELIRYKIDLVHISGGSWQYKGFFAAKVTGIPVIWHLNDTSTPVILRALFRFLSRFADGFIFSSYRTREHYESVRILDSPNRIIPAPVDPDRFDSRVRYSGDEELIKSWNDDIIVGTVANVNPIKDLDTFIRAAAILKESVAGIRFVVLGTIFENQQSYYRRLLRDILERNIDNIEFVGGRSDVRPILSRFDIYVCSSRAESSPISVWEAMAMGKPVVSTSVGDVPRHIRCDDSGYIVAVGDHSRMAENISKLALDERLRTKFGATALLESRNFAPDKISRLTADLYLEVFRVAV